MSDSLWPYGLSLPGSSVDRILQARILEWVAISFSRGSSWPRDWICVTCNSCLAGWFWTSESPEKPLLKHNSNFSWNLWAKRVKIHIKIKKLLRVLMLLHVSLSPSGLKLPPWRTFFFKIFFSAKLYLCSVWPCRHLVRSDQLPICLQ